MSKKFLDENGLAHFWDKIKSTFATKEELNNVGIGGSDGGALTIPCYFDGATMTIKNEENGVLITTEAFNNAFNNNKYICLKVDASALAGVPTYFVAPLGQIVQVPNSDTPLLYFYFLLSMEGVLQYINVELWVDSNTGAITPTSLATIEQLGGLTFTTSNTAPTGVSDNIITFVNEG